MPDDSQMSFCRLHSWAATFSPTYRCVTPWFIVAMAMRWETAPRTAPKSRHTSARTLKSPAFDQLKSKVSVFCLARRLALRSTS
ncbi:hypothetical protein D3C78_1694100 [compost metagenome]